MIMEFGTYYIKFTEDELRFLERNNPTIFGIAIWINKQYPGTFLSGTNSPINENSKLQNGIHCPRIEVSNLCVYKYITDGYAASDLCEPFWCSCLFSERRISCYELTWLEVVGKIPIKDRKAIPFKERNIMLKSLSKFSIKVV